MGMIRKLYRSYIKHFKPLRYAEKVGVNFPTGGGTHLRKGKLEY